MASNSISHDPTLEVEKRQDSSNVYAEESHHVMDSKQDPNLKGSLDREEKGGVVGHGSAESGSVSEKQTSRFKSVYRRHKYLVHIFLWLFFTGYASSPPSD